jgi:hypothetical protein
MAEQPWVWGSASRGSEGSANRVGISQPGSSQQRGKRQPEVHRGGYTAAQGTLMRTTAVQAGSIYVVAEHDGQAGEGSKQGTPTGPSSS